MPQCRLRASSLAGTINPRPIASADPNVDPVGGPGPDQRVLVPRTRVIAPPQPGDLEPPGIAVLRIDQDVRFLGYYDRRDLGDETSLRSRPRRAPIHRHGPRRLDVPSDLIRRRFPKCTYLGFSAFLAILRSGCSKASLNWSSSRSLIPIERPTWRHLLTACSTSARICMAVARSMRK